MINGKNNDYPASLNDLNSKVKNSKIIHNFTKSMHVRMYAASNDKQVITKPNIGEQSFIQSK